MTALLRESRGRLVVVQLEVRTREPFPAEGVGSRDLRAIRFSDALTAALEAEAELREVGMGRLTPSARRRLARTATRKRQGQRKDDLFYAEIAELYLAAVHREPTRAIAALTVELRGRGRQVAEGTVRDWVRAAARYGWLTNPGQGRRVREATDQLKAWQKDRRKGEG